MPGKSVAPRVGIIDAAVSSDGACIVKTRNFSGSATTQVNLATLQHGNGVAGRIIEACPEANLYLATVFTDSLVCRPEQVADAMDWLVSAGVQVINMSFGLRRDRELLRQCCLDAARQGVCLVAAAPAQGQGVYPSSYPGVVRATGDARCAPGEISFLASRQADFGAYPGEPGDAFAGASAGCASVAGAVAALAGKNPGHSVAQLLELLSSAADYRGVEKRPATCQPVTNGAESR